MKVNPWGQLFPMKSIHISIEFSQMLVSYVVTNSIGLNNSLVSSGGQYVIEPNV